MTREEILRTLREDECANNGEILEIDDFGVLYYDYEYGVEIYFRDEQFCTNGHLMDICFLGKTIENKGLTKEFVANMLKEAFNDSFIDAITTLRGIVVFSNEEEYREGIQLLNSDYDIDELLEEFPYENVDGNVCGKTWFNKQMIFVNEKVIYESSLDISAGYYDFDDVYNAGICQTLIHELRHCMLDTNPFLPEDKYSNSEINEDAVEDFCRYAYDCLINNKRFLF